MVLLRERAFFLTVFVLFLILKLYSCNDEKCNRIPLQSKTSALPPDDRFGIQIVGVESTYIPGKEYRVILKALDDRSHFIAFTIYAEGGEKPNDKPGRKNIPLQPGTISSSKDKFDEDSIKSNTCKNTVTQATLSPKRSVEVLWIAPPKGNGCVKIYAFVAVKRDVWYNSDGPLSKIICEDTRKNEDMKPAINHQCNVCEEARYELMFEGLWSFNTHPDMFPTTPNVAKIGDIVGASHNEHFILYKDDAEASNGLKRLVEQGNTSVLEEAILDEGVGTNLRTLIKATGPPTPSKSTLASFRATKQHHLLSLVTAILPSPDWFLGAYDIELCEAGTGTKENVGSRWAKRVVLNLYPMDAGVDSGATFESPNEATNPQATIAKARIVPDKDLEDYRPFARIVVTLVTTYPQTTCEKQEPDATTEEGGSVTDSGEEGVLEPSEEPETKVTSPPPPPGPAEDSDARCPLTPWEEWQPCEGDCVDGEVAGYKSRFRSYFIDGVKTDGTEGNRRIKIPPACFDDRYSLIEMVECKEPCEVPTEESEALTAA